MLPAPGQGAIQVSARLDDSFCLEVCQELNDPVTELCTRIERDFLRALLGGCSTPIGALAEMEGDEMYFRGNILLPDGSRKASIEKVLPADIALNLGRSAAEELLAGEGREILERFQHAGQ
jgi:hydroxymethylbilane synthase